MLNKNLKIIHSHRIYDVTENSIVVSIEAGKLNLLFAETQFSNEKNIIMKIIPLSLILNILGKRPAIPCRENHSKRCKEHLRTHVETGGWIQAFDLGYDSCGGKPHANVRPNFNKNWPRTK